MSKFTDNIRKIAQTAETNAKIKPPVFVDKSRLPSQRGVGRPAPSINDFCNIIYSTRDNGYDIAGLLSGTVGPLLNNPCDHIDRILGLTDLDTAQNTENFGGAVNLIIHVDGLFTES